MFEQYKRNFSRFKTFIVFSEPDNNSMNLKNSKHQTKLITDIVMRTDALSMELKKQ